MTTSVETIIIISSVLIAIGYLFRNQLRKSTKRIAVTMAANVASPDQHLKSSL